MDQMGGTSEFTGVEAPGTETAGSPRSGLSANGTANRLDQGASRRWRTVWRVHFYAGVFALPILILLSLTGLVILYTEPIQNAMQGDLRTVVVGDERVPLEEQRATVVEAFPGLTVGGVIPPKADDRSTLFSMQGSEGPVREVFVNPYTGKILGSHTQGSDLVGLANRLHGTLNNDSLTVKLPSLSGIFGDRPAFADYPVGELIVEVFACWGLVLAATGIFLWWPRKAGTGKPMFFPRLARLKKGGRARWRDLHALGGIAFAGILVFFVTSGLPWSSYWGEDWTFASSKVTPAAQFDLPVSAVARTGDLDRFDKPIEWAVRDVPVPASGTGGAHHGEDRRSGNRAATSNDDLDENTRPATMSLDQIARVARAERMQPGYTITLPVDSSDDGVYGSYVLADPWPARLHTSKTVYLDQFSGATLARTGPYDNGALAQATSFGVQNHMGTQYGLATRIVMTGGALLLLWMAFTAMVMWWKRRPKGTAGFPRRSADASLPRGLKWSTATIGIVYPLWAISALLVFAIDRFAIRRIRPLRAIFGMR